MQAMKKSQRLVQLLQELRLLDPPITACNLSRALDVSERTIYRDIDELRASGARIEGEAGYGYSLVEDPAMPPQVFSREEIEALVLGLREVREVGDPALAKAADTALSKLHATLPSRLKGHLKHSVLHAKRFKKRPAIKVDVGLIRQAAWQELAIDMAYSDAAGKPSQRRVYPLSIVYLDDVLVLVAYCCLRRATRAFRLDRIRRLRLSEESFYPRRVSLLRDALAVIKRAAPADG